MTMPLESFYVRQIVNSSKVNTIGVCVALDTVKSLALKVTHVIKAANKVSCSEVMFVIRESLSPHRQILAYLDSAYGRAITSSTQYFVTLLPSHCGLYNVILL